MKPRFMSHLVLTCYAMTLLLLPFARLSELPVLILALCGIFATLKHFKTLRSDPRFKILSLTFFCYFFAILISASDSFWQQKTLIVGFASLRFYLATVAMIYYLRKDHITWLIKISAVICALWSMDALIQYFWGTNTLGFQSYPGRLNGIFGEQHAKLGPVLALLLPSLLVVMISAPKIFKWVVLLIVCAVILLSGTRSAWIMLAFSLLAFFLIHIKQNKWLLLIKTSSAGLLLIVCLWIFSPSFKDRMDRTISAFDGSASSLDFALANRLPIWKVSWEMIKSHPVNGIGAHAFRKAYPLYANEEDIWQKNGGVGMHAHHWILEILAETGIIGLILLGIAISKLIQFMRIHYHSLNSWPFIVALTSAFLPVVSTYSIFASFWSICLWLVGSAFIAVSVRDD